MSTKSKHRGKKKAKLIAKNAATIKKKASKKHNIKPELLVRKATITSEDLTENTRFIKDLPLDARLKEAVLKKGYERLTEVQDKSLDALLEGKDILGIAQTGTGKTAAYLLPLIQQLIETKKLPHALIVVPTRELALQIETEFKTFTKDLKLHVSSFIGGTNISKDIQSMRRPAHVIIGTPGRLLDLVNNKSLDLRLFKTLVLDEFDRMLEMGFERDLGRICFGSRTRKHTLLFSATVKPKNQRKIDQILDDPITLKISSGNSPSDHIDQDIIRVRRNENKFDVLCEMLKDDSFDKVLIFSETKGHTNELTEQLNNNNIAAVQMHGDRLQAERQDALKQFKEGKVKVMVATDVAARGIDVSDVTHVINYKIPKNYDTYIHRIGRTGRAGKTGKSFTFID